MARQGYYTNPAEKKIEVFHRFDGGMNTATANENMADNEVRQSLNLNLVERGPVERRHGMTRHLTPPAGTGQGFFRLYLASGNQDIAAVSGRLYRNGVEIPIEGLTEGFQATRPVEAVQFQDRLWIATGTKLVEYDGTTAKVAEPYKPQPLEALYVGTNGLADDPNNYMQDGEALSFRIDGVTFSKRYGIVNEEVLLTAYKSIPAGKTVEFQFEYRHMFMEEGKWLLGQDWSASNTYLFKTDTEGDVQFRINMRETGLTVAEAQYLVPKYKIKPTKDPNDTEVPTERLDDCNRIILHWGRLIMYGDPTQPDAIYISHLNNPRYFPVPNSLRFENGRAEGLTTLVQYRDMLVGFTPTTIQALFGKSPVEFKRITLNTSVGCIAPDSAKNMRNFIFFLSYDGVYMLKDVGYTEDKANVEKVDNNVSNIVEKVSNACAVVHDDQYQIVFPDQNKRLRYYYHLKSWTMDESPKLNFHKMYVLDNEVYGQEGTSGIVQKFDKAVFDDDGHVYDDVLELKASNFGQPYHIKKLKEVQIMTSPKEGDINASVYIYADSQAVLNPEGGNASVDPVTGEVVWTPYFDVNYNAGAVFGDWTVGEDPFGSPESSVIALPLSGKCRTVKMKFVHREAKPSVVLGLAYIFKLKRP